jgi:hypothetical protein
VAAIRDTGGARHAPCGVMRALLRLVVLGGLVAAGWLLGSGASYADEDLGQPDPSPFHLVNLASADDLSGNQFGAPPAVGSVVKKVLSSTPVSRLSAQPPAQVALLKPVVKTVGGSRPLTKVLKPVVRSVSEPGVHRSAIQSLAQVERPVSVLRGAPAVTAPTDVAPTRTPPVAEFTPAHPLTPVGVLCSQAGSSQTKVAPAGVATSPGFGFAQTVTSDAPVAPNPARSPVSTTSPCTIGGSGGGASTKNTSDIAVRDSWTEENRLQPRDLHSRDTSDLPQSLSTQPSTSPD